MNFCTRCGSFYSQPGTCNCFAHGHPVAVPVQPIIPVWPRPYQEPLPWRPSGTGDPFPPRYDTTCTCGVVSVDTANLAHLERLGLITYTGGANA